MGTFTVASAAAADEVILSNSFESGSFAPWGPRGGTTVAITAESGHDSAHSLSVTNRTANWNGTQTSMTAMFAEGVVYQISGWVKLPVGTTISTGVKFTVQATPTAGGGDTFTQVNNPVTTDANTWVQIAGSYTRPAGLSSLILYVEAADNTAPFLVDDIQITGPSSQPDVITVSSVNFEDGTIGNWTQSGGGAGLLTVVAGPTGGQVLSVNNRAADYEGIQSPTGIFEPNKTYSFSMKVRLAAGTAGSVGVRFVMKPAFTWIGPTNMNADDWTTVTGTWTAPSDGNPATLQVYIGTGDMSPAAPYTYLVDDILITTEGGGGGPELPPDFVPGGAINPMPTPVNLAQGTGNVAALTFDDGPNPAITPLLLDYLASKNIKAVFCVIGQVINSGTGAEILRRIVAEGHTLCNHSTNFDDMGALTAAQAQQRMIENMTIIRTALGDPNAKIPFWRAPNGSWGATQNVAVSLGMQPLAVVNTISDWVTQDIPTLTANLRAAMKPGELVLCHDGGGDRSGTFAAVQTVVNERLAAGWTFSFPQGTPPPAGEVAIDTDFESGFDGWVPRDGGPGAPTVTISNVAHGGTGAALISNRPNQGAGLGHNAAMLRVGVTYELTAWLRFGDGLPTDEIWLTMQSNNGSGDSFATLTRFTGLTNTGYTKVTASFTMQPFQTAFLYFETRYQGGATGNTSDFLVDDILLRVPEPPVIQDLPALFSSTTFPVGVAIDNRETVGTSSSLLTRHFNQVTPENHMKPEAWYDADRNFRPHDQAIAIMDFAKNNNIRVYGHTLVWHSQTPAWFFQDASGNPLTTSAADQQILRDRLRAHINNIAQSLSTRYGLFGSDTNPLRAFDVVNEVVSDSGEFADGLRRSEWYRILGETYIDLAFNYAHEAFNGTYAVAGQDPVKLFINDYNTEQGGKQTRLRALVERLLARGVPVQGVGHQFHLSLSTAVSTLDSAFGAFDSLPVVQAVTEMDVTTGTPVTQANLIDQGYFYRDAFRIFRAHASKMFSVTVWGLIDGRSWRASSGAPLIFDNGYQAKPAYYGATDGTLPARLRTANVFAGDVPLTASATTSLEWKKLPLHAIESTGKFQLRWAPDHMTAFVSVNDTTSNAGDKVYFTLNSQPYTVNRNGTGDVPAVATERSGGYDIVAHLPLTNATQGSTASLDVQVTDNTTTTGWNTPGAVGTLSLIEALSYLEVNQARTVPVIDGAVDALWAADAGSVTTGKQVNGTGGATANVRTLWKNQTLYVLAEVTDPIIDLTGSDPWTKDSVEIYVDGGNFKNGPYRFDDTQIRINADNGVSFGTGDETFQRNRLVSATGRSATGYVVEAAISLLEYGGLGTFHGLDFQVNDASNGVRTSIHNWADELGTGYQTTAHWGVGQLIGPRPIINLVAPSITGTPVRGNTLTANPGQWSVPGVTFTYQWQRDGVNIKKETGRTYKVKAADVDHQLRVIVTARATGYDPVSAASAPVLATDKRCQRPLE